jgi:peptidoglycan/LPS O-acetylase OafA/YrhL
MFLRNFSMKKSITPLKIEELESLRGLAALLVFMHHFFEWNPIIESKIFINSYLMVDLFFVLSGFVIFNAYAEKINSGVELIRFQFLRFGRLYPVHILFIVLFLLFALAKFLVVLKAGYSGARNDSLGEFSAISIFLNVLLLQTVIPVDQSASINPPAWSISVEFYTYLIFGFIVLLFHKFKNYIFGLLAIVSMLILAINFSEEYGSIFRCFAGFFSGCITANWIKKLHIQCSKYASALLMLLMILFLQIKSVLIQNTVVSYDVIIYFLSSMLIAAIVINPNGVLNVVLKNKLLAWFGLISYSLYMSHLFVIHLVASFFKFFLHRPDVQMPDGTWLPSLSHVETGIAFVVSISVTLLLSHLIFSYIEKPMREKSRQFAFSKIK